MIPFRMLLPALGLLGLAASTTAYAQECEKDRRLIIDTIYGVGHRADICKDPRSWAYNASLFGSLPDIDTSATSPNNDCTQAQGSCFRAEAALIELDSTFGGYGLGVTGYGPPQGYVWGAKDASTGNYISTREYRPPQNTAGVQAVGFPLNVGLIQNVQVPNLLPLHQSGPESTLAVVAPPATRSARPLDLAERKLVGGGYVDPITGQPMIREVDLELPMGGSTYRMIRTYGGDAMGDQNLDTTITGGSPLSANSSSGGGPFSQVSELCYSNIAEGASSNLNGYISLLHDILEWRQERPVASRYWDWHGIAWMSSEAPLLLVDSQLVCHDPTLPPTCELVLDAHHSIPFTMDRPAAASTNSPPASYVAPGWYDALMTRSGRWDPLTNRYAQPLSGNKDVIDIWLAGRSVKYTFEVQYDNSLALAVPIYAHQDVHDYDIRPLLAESDQNGLLGNILPALNSNGQPIFANDPPVVATVKGRYSSSLIDEDCKTSVYYSNVQLPSITRQTTVAPGATVSDKAAGLGVSYTGGGLGAPRYALLQSITDSSGNKATMSYCARALRANEADDGFPKNNLAGSCLQVTRAESLDNPVLGPHDCKECKHNCNERGQLSRVQLQDSTGKVLWTMVYVYRGFRDWKEDSSHPDVNRRGDGSMNKDKDSDLTRQHAVALVYVFEGDPGFQPACMTLSADWFVKRLINGRPTGAPYASMDERESLEPLWETAIAAQFGFAMPSTWKYRLQYIYEEPNAVDSYGHHPSAEVERKEDGSTNIFDWGTSGPYGGESDRYSRKSPVLLRVEKVVHNQTNTSSPGSGDQKFNTAYSYLGRNAVGKSNLPICHTSTYTTIPSIIPKLRAIYRDEGLRRFGSLGDTVTVNSMYSPEPVFGTVLGQISDKFERFAEVVFDWRMPTALNVVKSSWIKELLGQETDHANELRLPTDRLACANRSAMVGRVVVGGSSSLNDGTAQGRAYDLSYFFACPPDKSMPNLGRWPEVLMSYEYSSEFNIGDINSSNPVYNGYHCRGYSLMLFPHTWFNEASQFQTCGMASAPATPLDQEMYLCVSDEHPLSFDSTGKEISYSQRNLANASSGDYSNMSPKLPDIREVVALNAPGYVLWQRSRNCKTGSTSGESAAVQYVYETYKKSVVVDNSDSQNPVKRDVDALRLTQFRSLGWGVVEASHGSTDNEGLVVSYQYATPTSTTPSSVGVSHGTHGQKGWSDPVVKQQSTTFGDGTDENYLVSSERYPEGGEGATASAESGEYSARTYYPQPPASGGASSGQTAAIKSFKVKEEVRWKSPAPLRPGSADVYYPFERKLFDERGLVLARAYGLTRSTPNQFKSSDWAPNTTQDLVFVDAFAYDDKGRPRVQVVDWDSGRYCPTDWSRLPGLSIQNDSFPNPLSMSSAYRRCVPTTLAGYVRLSQPLHLCTGYRYAADGAPDLVGKPGGRYDFSVRARWTLPTFLAGQLQESAIATYSDAVFRDADSSSTWMVFTKPGTITYYSARGYSNSWKVRWNATQVGGQSSGGDPSMFIPNFGTPNQGLFVLASTISPATLSSQFDSLGSVVQDILPTLDDRGRLTSLGLQGVGSFATELVSEKVLYTDFGLVNKHLTPSGTIDRAVTNRLGQALLEFRGTKDRAEYWGTNDDTNSPSTREDDMMLLRKHEYGLTKNDVRQEIATRQFRQKPSVLPQDGIIGANGTLSNPSTEDNYGWRTEYKYDERMRKVATITRADSAGSNAPTAVLKATVQWLDNIDRVRFQASYEGDGVALLGTINPATYNCFNSLTSNGVSAAAILQRGGSPSPQSPRLASLQEYRFNARGNLEETRTYDVGDITGRTFSAVQSYFDHTGRSVCSVTSDGHVTVSICNAIGQLVSSVTTAGLSREIERVDNQYTVDNLLEVSSHVVRVPATNPATESSNALAVGPSGNAVRTDTVHWFDRMTRKKVATAILGTDDPNGRFVNTSSSTPPIGPSAIVDQSGHTIVNPWPSPPYWDTLTQAWVASSGGGGWTADSLARLSRAQITSYGYDSLGRLTDTRSPGGLLMSKVLDGFDRVRFEQETLPDGSVGARKVYVYKGGLLRKIVSVRPEVTVPVSLSITEDYSTPRRGFDVTEVIYGVVGQTNGAPIVDPYSNTPELAISQSFDWPIGLRYPQYAQAITADTNGNGSFETSDIFAFNSAWFAKLPAGDYNHDGIIDTTDIFDFLAGWFAHRADPSRPNRPAGDVDIAFAYTIDGLVAERAEFIDYQPNGTSSPAVRQRFQYDEFGRTKGVKALATGGAPMPASVDAITRTAFAYDVLDRVTRATSWSTIGPAGAVDAEHIVSDNAYVFDAFGNVVNESASYGAPLGVNSPFVSYGWESSLSAGQGGQYPPIVRRLSSMCYPFTPLGAPSDALPATIHYGYGAPGEASELLNRVESIGLSESCLIGSSSPTRQLAQYQYAGSSMCIGTKFFVPAATPQEAMSQSYKFGSGLASGAIGLDSLGRPSTLQYTKPTGNPSGSLLNIWTANYAYDAQGNRISEDIDYDDLLSVRGESSPNERSWRYTYSPQSRLTSAKSGPPDPSDSSDGIRESFSQAWTLDDLGNWGKWDRLNDPKGGLLETTSAPLASSRVLKLLPTNEHCDVVNQQSGPAAATSDTTLATPAPSKVNSLYTVHGRLSSDGFRTYEYDFFGRITQIRSTGIPEPSSGQLAQGAGNWVVHYTYDAFGRVIRAVRPMNTSNTSATPKFEAIATYYDGARPLQEVRARLDSVPIVEDDERLGFVTRYYPPSLTTSPMVGSDGSLLSPWKVFREYVHSMEAGAFVDDVLAQRVYVNASGVSSATATLLYHVRDANHNVVALTDDRGNPVARYGYTPFGVPRWAEMVATESIEDNQTPKPTSTSIAAARLNRIGHQGLMIERVDTPWGAPMGVDDSAGGGGAGSTLESRGLVSASARFLYHNRNRLYNPAQGRFLGRDPNGLGTPVMEGLVFGGRAVGVPGRLFDVTRHTGDGINTHGAYGDNPFRWTDPAGLESIAEVQFASTTAAGLGTQAAPGFAYSSYASLSAGYGAEATFTLGAGSGAVLPGLSFGAGSVGSASGILGWVGSLSGIGAIAGSSVLPFVASFTSEGGNSFSDWLTPSRSKQLYASAYEKTKQGGQLTSIAVGLQSHWERNKKGTSFPQPPNSAAGKNALADEVFRRVLNEHTTFKRIPGGGCDLIMSEGWGMRLLSDGSFRGFLEPTNPSLDWRK